MLVNYKFRKHRESIFLYILKQSEKFSFTFVTAKICRIASIYLETTRIVTCSEIWYQKASRFIFYTMQNHDVIDLFLLDFTEVNRIAILCTQRQFGYLSYDHFSLFETKQNIRKRFRKIRQNAFAWSLLLFLKKHFDTKWNC